MSKTSKHSTMIYEVDNPENNWMMSFSTEDAEQVETCFDSIKKSKKINWDLYDRGLMIDDLKITRDKGKTYKDWDPSKYPDNTVKYISQIFLVATTCPKTY